MTPALTEQEELMSNVPTYFARSTKRSLACQRSKFTAEQTARLQALRAFGPLAAQPVDKGLALMGWIERYDDTDSVDLVAHAPDALVAQGI